MNILKIKNTMIKINIFMLILFVFYFYFGYFIEVSIMLLTVLVHECSHVFIAKKFGFEAKEIEIFPFGGIARLEKPTISSPKEEILICIMGPFSNLILMTLFMCIKSFDVSNYGIDYIININKLMLLLNILPIFPLDGGKVLRSVLSTFIGYKSATVNLTYITYFICTFVILYDIFNCIIRNKNIFVSVISIFTIIAAKMEREMAAFVFIRGITGKMGELKKRKVMKAHLLVCFKTVSVKDAIEYFLQNRYHIFIIIKNNGEVIGTVTETQLLEGIYRYGFDITLGNLLIETEKW